MLKGLFYARKKSTQTTYEDTLRYNHLQYALKSSENNNHIQDFYVD